MRCCFPSREVHFYLEYLDDEVEMKVTKLLQICVVGLVLGVVEAFPCERIQVTPRDVTERPALKFRPTPPSFRDDKEHLFF